MPRIKAALSPPTSPQLQRQMAPAEPADSPCTPQSTNRQPITPSSRRRGRQRADSDDDYEPGAPSSTKRIQTPRGAPLTPSRTSAGQPPQTPCSAPPTPSSAVRTPSQKALTAAKRKQEKEWESEWDAIVARKVWTLDRHFRHSKDTTTIFRGEAMKKYPVKQGELDMLPYQTLPNRRNRAYPIRLYNHEAVKHLACVKYAILAGLHKNGPTKAELASQGEELWKSAVSNYLASQGKRDQRYMNRRMRPVMDEYTYTFDDFVIHADDPCDHSYLKNETAEDDDTEPRTWDTYNCGYGSGNFMRRINE